jgi:hypothetical protein
MAFNVIPKNLTEMREAAGEHTEQKYRRGIITFYRKIVDAHPSIPDPLAFDGGKSSGKSVKIIRALKGEIDIAKLKRQCELPAEFKVSFGDGSRGNRGTGNRGHQFEFQLEKGLNDWIEEGDYHTNPYKDYISDLIKYYDLENSQELSVVSEGPENKKRPIQFESGSWKIGDATATNYDIGATVTDLTLTAKSKRKTKVIYLSLKTSGTTTMSNLGVKKIFPKSEIQAGQITNTVGLKLLETFGIDNGRFCKIFNEALIGIVRSGGDDNHPQFNKLLLQSMIRGSIGYGYHYTHKTGSKIKNFPMTKQKCDAATRVSSVTVHYGGKTGNGQRIDITVKTPVMELKFNIRDTSGSPVPWPDKLQSGYKFNDEGLYSISEDGYDD